MTWIILELELGWLIKTKNILPNRIIFLPANLDFFCLLEVIQFSYLTVHPGGLTVNFLLLEIVFSRQTSGSVTVLKLSDVSISQLLGGA